MKPCENCGNDHDETYGSGRFCSTKCSRGFSTKEKRKEINEKVRLKILGTGHGNVTKECAFCHQDFKVTWNKRNQECCSDICSSKKRWENDLYKKHISSCLTEHYKIPENRNRLRDIGRKGGFGTKGYTKAGIHYQSSIEKSCFEYLDENNIVFEAHKNVPNSSKVSDIYFPTINLWVEIDGINREAKKKWIGKDYDYWQDKLKTYNDQNLKLVVIYNLNDLKELVKNGDMV